MKRYTKFKIGGNTMLCPEPLVTDEFRHFVRKTEEAFSGEDIDFTDSEMEAAHQVLFSPYLIEI